MSLIVFACIFGGALCGIFPYAVLPQHHRGADYRDSRQRTTHNARFKAMPGMMEQRSDGKMECWNDERTKPLLLKQSVQYSTIPLFQLS
jgi:hypothetical protein